MNLFIFLFSSVKVSSEYIPETAFGKFVEDYHILITVGSLSLLFLRIPLGMLLDYRENKNKSSDKLHHKQVQILYIVGWWKVKNKQNKTLAVILNIMLVCFILIFLGLLIGSIVSNELH